MISEKSKQLLYHAIHEPIMELRLEIKMAVNSGDDISAEGLDSLLRGLIDTIWSQQKHILKITP